MLVFLGGGEASTKATVAFGGADYDVLDVFSFLAALRGHHLPQTPHRLRRRLPDRAIRKIRY